MPIVPLIHNVMRDPTTSESTCGPQSYPTTLRAISTQFRGTASLELLP
ncbi:hypothetical protein HNP40_000815 [Mycobacteroides chelonae]|nr:hypothetical protein [Mycobacteroides chelonae]